MFYTFRMKKSTFISKNYFCMYGEKELLWFSIYGIHNLYFFI